MGILDALLDKQFRSDVGSGLKDVMNRGVVGGLLGAPVDITTMALRPLGYKTENPVMGSEWIGKKMQDAGLVSGNRNQLAEMLAGFVDPATMATGAVKGAAMLPAMAGMFIGKGAKTWDVLQAQKALDMEKAGTAARHIWKETGTWKAPDGMWRQEIPDNKAFYDPEALSDLKLNNPNFDYLKHTQPLGGVIDHKALYQAYPDVGDIKTHFMPVDRMRGSSGSYAAKHDRMTLTDTPKDQSSIALHEIQHAIQHREGWNPGGSPSQFSDQVPYEDLISRVNKQQDAYLRAKESGGIDPSTGLSQSMIGDHIDKMIKKINDWKSPDEQYRLLAGEAEARATQARIPLDAAQRRALFPEDSYDVPINQLIIRGLLK